MTLDDKLRKAIAAAVPPGPVSCDDGTGRSVNVDLQKTDEMGCKVRSVQVHRTDVATAGLEPWARRTADRVTGLLEPLRLIELDPTRDEAILRSQKPAQKQGEIQYYEMHMSGSGDATLNRYLASQDSPERKPIDFVLTHEALGKLVEDVAS
jgi:hypothetical protein